jgi:dihydrofolate synthase/folylpolyglutamate synthase
MLSNLLPECDAVVFTTSQNPRALPPPTLLSLSGQLGGPAGEIVPEARAAVARGQELAGVSGAVVVTGSIYLIADVLRPAARGRVSML